MISVCAVVINAHKPMEPVYAKGATTVLIYTFLERLLYHTIPCQIAIKAAKYQR